MWERPIIAELPLFLPVAPWEMICVIHLSKPKLPQSKEQSVVAVCLYVDFLFQNIIKNKFVCLPLQTYRFFHHPILRNIGTVSQNCVLRFFVASQKLKSRGRKKKNIER